MKKSCPACQGYPTCRGETTRPPELSRLPRRVCNPNVNGLLVLQRNKLKVTSTRVTWGEGCLGHPRPCKWGLSRYPNGLTDLTFGVVAAALLLGCGASACTFDHLFYFFNCLIASLYGPYKSYKSYKSLYFKCCAYLRLDQSLRKTQY